MNKNICVLTGTRAEYGLLRPLLFKLQSDSNFCLNLLVTGTHLSEKFGNTQVEIAKDGFAYDSVFIPIEGDSKLSMACNTGVAVTKFANYLEEKKPDLFIVLGDRYEAYAAATAAYILSIPIAHIAGGDITEGALDDGFRHCITKMSNIHFPGCEDSARRIIQMGERPDTVYNVGAPGVENCLKTKFLSINELEKEIKFSIVNKRYGVITFHPVTQEENTAVHQLKELILALEEYPDMQFIITTANADAGGRAINALWLKEAQYHKNWFVVTSLGVVRYLSAVKYSSVVIGNSSSGIAEAPVLGVPTVNIGDRQKGRMFADSVISCLPEHKDIIASINKALTPEMKLIAVRCESPFGNGETSRKIIEIIREKLFTDDFSSKKVFYDL